ncbi:DUF1064 domain-containing protein [Mesobacillus stamsii]|uniref:DUF1064 domain-containing protein n=1 Tax=Mesobacillus stamsii TaxID=225347 RepID=A0ABU0FWA4_9BACI|nr:DUF1064 domain-containing protein [Mesobacillus stamsii]MDQ0414199.1 hypothetical protein [Mesobacillus stamsii]
MSKYNAVKTSIDGFTFDSKVEGEYYLKLKEKQRTGEILAFELQPKFLLQNGFRKEGKWIHPIHYIADFEVTYPDGRVEIVDIKGQTTQVFDLKKKLFYAKHPDKTLKLLKKVNKYGGFIELDEYARIKKEEKKNAK